MIYVLTGRWSWKFYGAEISAVHDDGTYSVQFDDGDSATNVPKAQIRRVFHMGDHELHEIHTSADGCARINVQEPDGSWVPIHIYRSGRQKDEVILSFGKGKFEGLNGGYTLIYGKLRDADGDEINYEVLAPGDKGKSEVAPLIERTPKDPHAQSIKTKRTLSRRRAVVNNERIDYLLKVAGQPKWSPGFVQRETQERDWFKVITLSPWLQEIENDEKSPVFLSYTLPAYKPFRDWRI